MGHPAGNVATSPITNVARYRLALLDARSGNVESAIDKLAGITDPDHQQDAAGDSPLRNQPSLEKLLAKKPPEASLETEFVDLPVRAANLLSLLRHNREPTTGDAPLVAYLNCDPRHANYHQNLRGILERFSPCKIRDNIEVQLTLIQPSPSLRIERLLDIRSHHPQGDTLPEIMYELGVANLEEGRVAEAREFFDELIMRFPGSTFAAEARRRRPHSGLGTRQPPGV